MGLANVFQDNVKKCFFFIFMVVTDYHSLCISRSTPRESDNGNCRLMMDEVISNVALISDKGIVDIW